MYSCAKFAIFVYFYVASAAKIDTLLRNSIIFGRDICWPYSKLYKFAICLYFLHLILQQQNFKTTKFVICFLCSWHVSICFRYLPRRKCCLMRIRIYWAWVPFCRNCCEHVKVVDVKKYFYVGEVNYDRFEYRTMTDLKFTFALFLVNENDLFKVITTWNKSGFTGVSRPPD